ncbi:hypothetical protein ACTJKC_01860 [Pedobacter sp. 22226]|uniref:hypothetical protein n=1 Tax=Pedobacter sp. 22226 TaxID=3453894 RepID=UPI003F846378
MEGTELKILFNQDKAYLTPDRSMTFEQVDLEHVKEKVFRSPAYWTFRIKKYIENERRIFCEILTYDIGETEFTNNQLQLSAILNSLEKVTFSSIDTGGLLNTLAGGRTGSLSHPQSTPINRAAHYNNYEPLPRPPQNQTIKETFSIPLKNVRFISGGVSFDIKIQKLGKSIAFTIPNEDILAEFDAVKNYFANVLKTKNIEVTAVIDVSDNEVISKVAQSPEIDKINRELIENVRFEVLKDARKKPNLDTDKNLFTMEEYLEAFTDSKLKSGIFFTDEQDFFENILKVSNNKHYKHLRYLSSKHASGVMKLRFTHNPFSFFFLIQGERNYHIVWETLNTAEATYIWSINKDPDVLKSTLKQLEGIMDIIKSKGRTAYLIIEDDSFNRIFHVYTESAEGFIKWKSEFESVMAKIDNHIIRPD